MGDKDLTDAKRLRRDIRFCAIPIRGGTKHHATRVLWDLGTYSLLTKGAQNCAPTSKACALSRYILF